MNLSDIGINVTELSGQDREEFALQLGREPRGLVAVGARCACGRPAVTVTLPRLADGSPFPTLFYLSLPHLVYEISRLEADGLMARYNELLAEDPELRAAHERAHHSYIQRRERLGEVPEIAHVSAGGMPTGRHVPARAGWLRAGRRAGRVPDRGHGAGRRGLGLRSVPVRAPVEVK